MDLLSGLLALGKPTFVCNRCAHCCSNISVPLFSPDLSAMSSRLNLSRMRASIKVYLSPGQQPPSGIRLFLDGGPSDRPPNESARCPFLEEGSVCSIYDSRPLACRRFPLGHKVSSGACPYWNGKPDHDMKSANKLWRMEEAKISRLGAEAYYRRWLNLLYPKGYIPPASIRKGVYWTPSRSRTKLRFP